MNAIKLTCKMIKNAGFKIKASHQFTDKFRDKELAEEKFYFDKEESFSFFIFRETCSKITE